MRHTADLLHRIDSLRDGPAQDEVENLTRLRGLERKLHVESQQQILLDQDLKTLRTSDSARGDSPPLPPQLCNRARRLLRQIKTLVGRLQAANDQFARIAGFVAALTQPGTEDALHHEPLFRLFQRTVAMADVALRAIQSVPSSAGEQMKLTFGLEEITRVISDRTAQLENRLSEELIAVQQLHDLSQYLLKLESDKAADHRCLVEIADAILSSERLSQRPRFDHAVARLGLDQPIRDSAPDADDVADDNRDKRRMASLTAAHGLCVAEIAARLALENSDWSDRARDVVMAALLLDAGMLRVPGAVVCHRGPLSNDQIRAIEGHVFDSVDIIRRAFPNAVWLHEAIAGHHERLDGSGYPMGARAHQIPELTRLLAVCDVYAALQQPRPQRRPLDPRTALTETLSQAENGCLDRVQAERLLGFSFYPVGTLIELDDGRLGVVAATHTHRRQHFSPARPVITVLTDEQRAPLAGPQTLDLQAVDGITIVRSLAYDDRPDDLCERFPELI